MKKKPTKKAPKKPRKPNWTVDELCEEFLRMLGVKPGTVVSATLSAAELLSGERRWNVCVTSECRD